MRLFTCVANTGGIWDLWLRWCVPADLFYTTTTYPFFVRRHNRLACTATRLDLGKAQFTASTEIRVQVKKSCYCLLLMLLCSVIPGALSGFTCRYQFHILSWLLDERVSQQRGMVTDAMQLPLVGSCVTAASAFRAAVDDISRFRVLRSHSGDHLATASLFRKLACQSFRKLCPGGGDDNRTR